MSEGRLHTRGLGVRPGRQPTVGQQPSQPYSPPNQPPAYVSHPAPLLGQHTDEVLTELLGCDADELDTLTKLGVLE